tara:strand:+ start:5520 stop:5771 length:252 start_codon:yes stop_codon:yes gene_type:complete
MEHQTLTQDKAASFAPQALDQATDQELTDLIKQASAILETRDAERKRTAIAKIKELAKAHGLDVAIEPRTTKRGRRPRRKETT